MSVALPFHRENVPGWTKATDIVIIGAFLYTPRNEEVLR